MIKYSRRASVSMATLLLACWFLGRENAQALLWRSTKTAQKLSKHLRSILAKQHVPIPNRLLALFLHALGHLSLKVAEKRIQNALERPDRILVSRCRFVR